MKHEFDIICRGFVSITLLKVSFRPKNGIKLTKHAILDIRLLCRWFMVIAARFVLTTVGGAVAQSVERATPGEEVPSSIPAVAIRSLLVGSVSV